MTHNLSSDDVSHPVHSRAQHTRRHRAAAVVVVVGLSAAASVMTFDGSSAAPPPPAANVVATAPDRCPEGSPTGGLVQSATAAEHRVLERAAHRVQSATAAEHRVLERAACR
ncbi:MAG: hypothetical protein Q8K58_03035 [Acidimicrobiales bacterium]|nr:hypothetical protein [Acidimicrobiales bacterium]